MDEAERDEYMDDLRSRRSGGAAWWWVAIWLVGVVVALSFSLRDAAAAEVVSWTTSSSGGFDCAGGYACVGHGSSPEAAADDLIAQHNGGYSTHMSRNGVASTPVLSSGQYSASVSWVQDAYSGVISLVGTCGNGCTGDQASNPVSQASLIPPLSVEDGAFWGFACAGIMTTAWAFKMLIRALGSDSMGSAFYSERDEQ